MRIQLIILGIFVVVALTHGHRDDENHVGRRRSYRGRRGDEDRISANAEDAEHEIDEVPSDTGATKERGSGRQGCGQKQGNRRENRRNNKHGHDELSEGERRHHEHDQNEPNDSESGSHENNRNEVGEGKRRHHKKNPRTHDAQTPNEVEGNEHRRHRHHHRHHRNRTTTTEAPTTTTTTELPPASEE